VLSFGGTKNGAIGAEALIVMRSGLSADVPYLRKQQTQLASKMRFVAAQFGALLHDDLWLASAPGPTPWPPPSRRRRHYPGVEIVYPFRPTPSSPA